MKSTLLAAFLMLCVALSVSASYPQISPLSASNSVETKLIAPDAARGDEFGRAVAVQGNTAIVGAPNEARDGFGTGAAYVWEKTATGWQFQQKLVAPDAAAFSFFGNSVAIDGDRIVVGAPGDPNAGNSAGAAYVFIRAVAQWDLEAKLVGSDNSAGDSFGFL